MAEATSPGQNTKFLFVQPNGGSFVFERDWLWKVAGFARVLIRRKLSCVSDPFKRV